jgi:hypothetical protein
MFLALLSYVVLCDYRQVNQGNSVTTQGLSISIPEVVLHVWTASIVFDEFRVVTHLKKNH